jgi:hypothetical protein
MFPHEPQIFPGTITWIVNDVARLLYAQGPLRVRVADPRIRRQVFTPPSLAQADVSCYSVAQSGSVPPSVRLRHSYGSLARFRIFGNPKRERPAYLKLRLSVDNLLSGCALQETRRNA